MNHSLRTELWERVKGGVELNASGQQQEGGSGVDILDRSLSSSARYAVAMLLSGRSLFRSHVVHTKQGRIRSQCSCRIDYRHTPGKSAVFGESSSLEELIPSLPVYQHIVTIDDGSYVIKSCSPLQQPLVL